MKLKLYHYVHCPYCIRVRLALGYLKLPWESVVTPYDDEETPKKLSGKKMLPILDVDGMVINESLDIIKHLDQSNTFSGYLREDTEQFLSKAGELVHNLAMPYWAYGPEFSSSARQYFKQKKEAKRGPFPDLALSRVSFEVKLNELLAHEEDALVPFWNSQNLTIDDIAIAAHLWGLYVVPEFRFSTKWQTYLTNIKTLCNFDYHSCLWRSI